MNKALECINCQHKFEINDENKIKPGLFTCPQCNTNLIPEFPLVNKLAAIFVFLILLPVMGYSVYTKNWVLVAIVIAVSVIFRVGFSKRMPKPECVNTKMDNT